MTRDEIIKLAREADPYGELGKLYEMAELTPSTLERFAALVAAAEREACAKIAARAAPQPPKLSDERIDKICDIVERDNVLFSQSGIYALARAIEREILGGGNG